MIKKSYLGVVCCLILMVTLWGCSADNFQATSAERLRELLAQTSTYPTDISTSPTDYGGDTTDISTSPTDYGGDTTDISTSPTDYGGDTTDISTQPTEYDPDSESDSYDGYLGYVPEETYGDLTEAERRGLQTWYYWTGFNEEFFRRIAKQSHGEIDFLSLLDARPDNELVPGDSPHLPRNQRFKSIGVVNDPSCQAATEPDEYGLWLDQCDKDANSGGVMGVRKFPNPDFDPEAWDVVSYYQPGEQRAAVEPPYRIGISCGVCHIAFNPLKPPADPENPKWENIVSALGNQYIKEGGLFGGSIPDEDFRKQVLESQPRGTSDTSRIATDHINNPNAINAIFNLADRPRYDEVMNDGSIQAVPHILKDGADSVGVALASLRVYVNIGMCSDQWLQRHDAVSGLTPQSPFDIEQARRDCKGWQETEKRMADAEKFLETIGPMHLEDAPGGKAYLTQDESILNRGKIVFADTCATCHSSKQPPADILVDPEQAKQWYRESVLSSDFRDHNFLSNDKRYPVTLIGTNSARALATNALQGHIWEQFSSKTYKELPSPGTLELENPYIPDKPIELEIPAGGRGYYRVPSLISIWSSAPFFHNNMLGTYTNDPSVAGRMEAFNDAIEKLLWPEKREGIIKRSDRETYLQQGKLVATVPKGATINLLANLDPRETPSILQRKLNSDIGSRVLEKLVDFIPDDVIAPVLLKANQVPDFIEDHGHYFGTELSDEDKLALIEFLKTL